MSSSNTQTTLTSPSDKIDKIKINADEPPLDSRETNSALAEQKRNVYKHPKLYRKIERNYVDPTYQNQFYCLHSFIPSSGATPDKDGFYGMFKFRGAFQTIEEADARAEWLIKHHDSMHTIYTGRIGFPLPACVDGLRNVSADVNEIGGINEFLKKDKEKHDENEKQIKEQIKQRETELLENTSNPNIDPYEKYIEMQNKKAILIDTYIEYKEKISKMKENITNVINEIKQLEESNPVYKNEYKDKLFKARADVNLSNNPEEVSFLKYLDVYETPL